MLKAAVGIGELIEELKVLGHEMDARLEAIARAAEAEVGEQDREFTDTCFTEIADFAKESTSLTRQALLFPEFADHLHEISYEVHETYHAALNAQVDAKPD